MLNYVDYFILVVLFALVVNLLKHILYYAIGKPTSLMMIFGRIQLILLVFIFYWGLRYLLAFFLVENPSLISLGEFYSVFGKVSLALFVLSVIGYMLI